MAEIKKDPHLEAPQEIQSRKKQLHLFPEKNPLFERFGKAFFQALPKVPGVYLMKSQSGILYVGKAKNLKSRIQSYAYARESRVSRKVMKLLYLVQTIEWEETEDEQSALLRENFLLRLHRPYFNVVNRTPELYLFMHLKQESSGIRFSLNPKEESDYSDHFGAFKSVRLTSQAYRALLRLIWTGVYGCQNGFDFPRALTQDKRFENFFLPLPDSFPTVRFYRELKRFYFGTSHRVIFTIIDLLLEREDMSPFMSQLIQEDIDCTLRFYETSAKRNKVLRKHFQLKTQTISQTEIDDLLVRFNGRKLELPGEDV